MQARFYNATTFFIGDDACVTNAVHGEVRGYWLDDNAKDILKRAVMDDFGNLVEMKLSHNHPLGRCGFYREEFKNNPIWY